MNRLVLIIFFGVIIQFSTNGYCGEVFVLSLSGDIVEYDIESGELNTLFNGEYSRWPCYNEKRNTLYFSSNSAIYSLELGRQNSSRSKLLNGMYPALSTDGNFLSFVSTGKLYIFDFENQQSWPVCTDAFDLPAVWISDRKLLYFTTDQHIKVIDVLFGQISGGWPDGIFPIALSPDHKTVLCETILPSGILLYNTDGRYIDTIKKPRNFLSSGGSLIWSSDGRSFIYEKSLLGFDPSLYTYDVYMFNIDTRKEKRILHNERIFGGVSIGPSKASHTWTGGDSEAPQAVPLVNTNDQLKWASSHD